MDYEKAYNNALEWARQVMNGETGFIREEVVEVFPELAESEDERIRKALIHHIAKISTEIPIGALHRINGIDIPDILAWLEKQGKQTSAIRWYDTSLNPEEMMELLVEWDSEDSTWHEVAFYHADTKTFWDGERQVENVTRWCYIDDILEKQGEQKQKWSEEDEMHYTTIVRALHSSGAITPIDMELAEKWLKSLKQRIEQ